MIPTTIPIIVSLSCLLSIINHFYTNNSNNPIRDITPIDTDIYNAVDNPVDIISPIENTNGYVEKLLGDNTIIDFEVLKPSIINSNMAEIDFHLLNEDSSYYDEITRWQFSSTS